MINGVKIEGYKSLSGLEVRLRPLVVLFGPNAAGKSNFLDALQLLSRLVTARTLKEAFDGPYRGTPLESFTFGAEGIAGHLKAEKLCFNMEVDVEISDSTVSSVERQIADMRKGNGGGDVKAGSYIKERLLRYRVEVEALPKCGILRVADEFLAALKDNGEIKTSRNPFLEKKDGRLSLRLEGQAHPTYHEIGLDHTIVSRPLYPPHYPHIVAFRQELAGWFFFYLEPRESMRSVNPVKEVHHIGLMGENLAAFLNTLKTLEPAQFIGVEKALKTLIPRITSIEVAPNQLGEVELRLKEDGVTMLDKKSLKALIDEERAAGSNEKGKGGFLNGNEVKTRESESKFNVKSSMAQSNHERIGKALEMLKAGLPAFVERELKSAHGVKWMATAGQFIGPVNSPASAYAGLRRDERMPALPVGGTEASLEWDAAGLLRVLWECWNDVFAKTLGRAERSMVSELIEVRNKWAHQKTFTTDDAYRAIDSMQRLLNAVGAREQADELSKQSAELLRLKFDEQARHERRKSQTTLGLDAPLAGLKPWREVVTPHPDVASGRYQLAEFAADLWEVYQGRGSDEYRDPQEFFRRTFLTVGLKDLLVRAVRRLAGDGSDPVVELQTNFGGGKTHSMLALYHLFSGRPVTDLTGLEPVMQEAKKALTTGVKRVVLVGTKIKPGQPDKKDDGTVVRTLWGEFAWQLGGKDGYAMLKEADETATNPGDALGKLLRKFSPCLILVDEWVAYARQLHDEKDLPGGDFETQFTFAQTLTEEVKSAPQAMLVVSLPASTDGAGGVSPTSDAHDEEVGGVRGRAALGALRNVVSRVATAWRPANADESFEIVRRRLFQPITESTLFTGRDNTAKAFCDLYRQHHQEFPAECREADFERMLKAAYPIHPEVFARLYQDWSGLVKFQRTRGVLRLMAAVIHRLWADNDKGPLILPASIPLDDPGIVSQLTSYLPGGWETVIERDVDGPGSLPRKLDGDRPNLGRFQACLRVARTLFLGSAPTPGAANRGEEDRRIKLGCVQPGEAPAVFGDALRYLAQAATYLYQDNARYWYSTQPTVTKLADDRAELLKREPEKVGEEIQRRVKEEVRNRGEFPKVHSFPNGSGDVPDELETRLVVLNVDKPFAREGTNPAIQAATEILEKRGTSPRLYRNTLVFLAADRSRLDELEAAARYFLAWESICDEAIQLNLDPFQTRQATAQRSSWDKTSQSRVFETFQWLLAPMQNSAQGALEWQTSKVGGSDPLAVRAGKKLKNDGQLITLFHSTSLRLELDKIPLWRGEHVAVKQLVEDFASYLYLQRPRNPEVLLTAIREGIASVTWRSETFAFAESFDEKAGRYLGLRAGKVVTVSDSGPGLLVKAERAARQLEEEETAKPAPIPPGTSPVSGSTTTPSRPSDGTGDSASPTVPLEKPDHFFGNVGVDAARISRDMDTIAKEVVQHLASLPGAVVKVTVEIQANVPAGVPEATVRTVSENCRTLKFSSHGFEKE